MKLNTSGYFEKVFLGTSASAYLHLAKIISNELMLAENLKKKIPYILLSLLGGDFVIRDNCVIFIHY